MSLNAAERAFAELLERCKLPEITSKDLLDKFLAQSMAAESQQLELEALRRFRGDVTVMLAGVLSADVRLMRAEKMIELQTSAAEPTPLLRLVCSEEG